jgi:hypothetical protein
LRRNLLADSGRRWFAGLARSYPPRIQSPA